MMMEMCVDREFCHWHLSTALCMRKKKAHAGWVCTFFWLAYIHCTIHTCKIKIKRKRKESVQKQDSVLRLPSRPLYTSRSDSEDVAGKQDVHDSKQIMMASGEFDRHLWPSA